jgi:hypothetical protein
MPAFQLRAILRFCTVLFLAVSMLPAQMTRVHRPTPKVGEFHVLKADLHMHTVFSDGQVWPTTRVMEAWREDLDVMAITDHDDYRPNEKDVNMDLERPYQIARPIAEGLGILIIPSVEITKGDIHFNALFIRDHNAFRGKDLLTALAEAKRQGAFSFWNHPGWRGKAEWWPIINTAYTDKLFQGIELVNGPSYYPEAHPWISQYKLTLMGTSDIHNASLPTEPRSISLLMVKERSLQGVREALDAGRTIAWQEGDRYYGSAALLEQLFRGYVQFPNEMRWIPGFWNNGIPLRNDSALRFEAKVLDAPTWMEVRPLRIQPQATTPLQFSLKSDAPKTKTRVRMNLEITNAMTGPGQHLMIPIEFDFIP